MSKKIFSLLIISLLVFSFSASSAWAQITLVPDCSVTGDCTMCDFLATLINFTNVVGAAAGTSAVLMLIIGGVMWILAGANEGMIEKGKKLVVGTFTGLIIVFFAWMLVNFLIYALAGDSLGDVRIFGREWWNPDCGQSKIEYEEDCTEVGGHCQKSENMYCYRADASVKDECGTGDKACSCKNQCEYHALTSETTSACIPSGGSCADEYMATSSYCAEGHVCCIKYKPTD